MRAAIFLDRDGVLNPLIESDGGVRSPRVRTELELAADAPEVVERLQRAGFLVFVVTNQPDVARGKLPLAELVAMNAEVRERLGVDDLRVCPHDDDDHCDCRKPLPGMLQVLARRWGVELSESYMIGDTWRDVEAGRAAGCRTILIRRSYNADVDADDAVDSLADAAELILAREAVHA
ncbi:MAG TPA: HAD-IIIA family hydrolase [Longimicrobiales bacterium]